ncbi:MAG TPA: hypothetical protein DE312_07595 [Gallionella sp.]|nr:MAG: hypothetical protein A2Z87_00400 [Gallionellales bacterium GWA2_54_124]OGT18462.1 MAG: hypothetical protein A2522_04585 [Gallionellales bacterium RIFOXYD12_FULL_53_10]HCI53158.1 hypothetical protein [Gallionella sp.]
MTDNPPMTLYDHIRALNSAMQIFQYQPTEQHRAALLETLTEYQQATAQGLSLSRAIPPPLEQADTHTQYLRRELNEALIQFKANPENGGALLDQLTTQYINEAQQGKIKP